MLDRLLETRQVRQRSLAGTALSLVLHVGVVAVAVQLSKRVVAALPKPDAVTVQFTALAPTPPPPPLRRAQAVGGIAAPAGTLAFTAPVDIAVSIPAIVLGEAVRSSGLTDPSAPVGVPGGTGLVGSAGLSDAPLSDFQVDKVAAAIPGVAPAYPEPLKAAGVEGGATVQFVIDTTGRYEPGSFRVLAATHEAFAAAVRAVLPRMRFIPAESGGQKVRMIVQQRFGFTLDR